MYDPRDTQDAFDTTLMGPGFFVFFQRGIIESGGYLDFESIRHTPRFKAYDEDEKEAKPILEDIAQQMADNQYIITRQDMEIVLRMRLREQNIAYKNLYMKWLKHEKKVINRKIKKEKEKYKKKLILLALFQ